MKTIKTLKNLKLALVILMVGIFMVSCSDDDTVNKVKYTGTPGEALLQFPANNQECEVGEVVDDKAYISFSWEASSETEKYNLEITNLITGNVTLNIGLPENNTRVTLTRGYPYSWKVTSRNSSNEETESETWKFYIAGEGESNFVPFPATLLSPSQGVTITPVDGKVTLEWTSTDADGDALTYTVYADTIDGNQEVPDEWQDISENKIEISVEPNTIYFWHIETSDGANISVSQTYTFKTAE